MSLKEELDKFWKWSNKTPLDYSKDRGIGEWEMYYERLGDIYIELKEEIKKINNEYSEESIFFILDAMAIDNEAVFVLEICEEELSCLDKLIEIGYKYYQPQARWQIAYLLQTYKMENREKILKEMLNDEDEYVGIIAKHSLENLDVIE
jgi:hypothetical protein